MDLKTEIRLMEERMDRHGADLKEARADISACEKIVQATAVNCATMSEQLSTIVWVAKLSVALILTGVGGAVLKLALK